MRQYKEWYDREGSREQFLSRSVHAMYLPTYFQNALHDSTGVKVGIAALGSLMATASGAYGTLFFVVIFSWAGDMVLGMLRVLREALKEEQDRVESFKWTRAADGLLRLVVIVIMPALLAMVGSVGSEVMSALVDVRPRTNELISMGLATFGLSWMLVHEFTSLLNNAASLHSGMRQVRDRFKTKVPGDK